MHLCLVQSFCLLFWISPHTSPLRHINFVCVNHAWTYCSSDGSNVLDLSAASFNAYHFLSHTIFLIVTSHIFNVWNGSCFGGCRTLFGSHRTTCQQCWVLVRADLWARRFFTLFLRCACRLSLEANPFFPLLLINLGNQKEKKQASTLLVRLFASCTADWKRTSPFNEEERTIGTFCRGFLPLHRMVQNASPIIRMRHRSTRCFETTACGSLLFLNRKYAILRDFSLVPRSPCSRSFFVGFSIFVHEEYMIRVKDTPALLLSWPCRSYL